ncbi:DUF1905 domain-containing protein [Cryobacterium lyxosi]|nr:DUF1905 domain-containing protein [Cryobacterium lyxosi]
MARYFSHEAWLEEDQLLRNAERLATFPGVRFRSIREIRKGIMPAQEDYPQNIDTTFTATVTTERNSGWTCVVMPESGVFFGTRKPVKVAGTIDGHPFTATLLPMGDGTHMVPLKAALRKTIGKVIGDEAEVHLDQRFS